MAVCWDFIPIIYQQTCQSQLQKGSIIAPLRWKTAPKLRRTFAAQSAQRIYDDGCAWICGYFFFEKPTRLPPSPQLGTRQCRQAPGRISRRVEPLHHRMHDAFRRQSVHSSSLCGDMQSLISPVTKAILVALFIFAILLILYVILWYICRDVDLDHGI